MPSSAAVLSKSVTGSRFDCAKRLVNSNPLSVWTHSTIKPCFLKKAYVFLKKFAEE